MSDPLAPAITRRHDLDALRAFAMVLGIALHGALSFTGYPWIVQDLKHSDLFGLLFGAIHGFRMPLFFLVSGYFTMMLWRRRGLTSLLKQRFWRVFVPCMLGVVTIVPALDRASIWAGERAASQDALRRSNVAAKTGLVELVRTHDLAGLEKQLQAGTDPNQVDPEFSVPALGWAALYGDAKAGQLLIDRGANVNITDKGGYRPLHSASFLGQVEVANLLLRNGADPGARGPLNDRARESSLTAMGTTKAICNALRVPLRAEDELAAGRAECRQLLARSSGEKEEVAAKPADEGSLDRFRKRYVAWLTSDRFMVRWNPEKEPVYLFLSSNFHHLWFLWFLCWLVAFFAIFAGLAQRMAIPRFPRRLILSPLRWLWLLPLTMLPQLLMGSLVPGFGPDTSAGILPQPHLLLYYGIFFSFGAFYYDADDQEGRLGRWWWLAIPLSLLIALPLGLATIGQVVVSGCAQVFYAWAMTFGFIGLFRSCLNAENKTIRYLSDSAYWLYLAHLPLIVLAQAWVRDWEWPAFSKFVFICVLVTGFLLVTYQILVRHTYLGLLLNGPRKRRPPVVDRVPAAELPTS